MDRGLAGHAGGGCAPVHCLGQCGGDRAEQYQAYAGLLDHFQYGLFAAWILCRHACRIFCRDGLRRDLYGDDPGRVRRHSGTQPVRI